VSKYYIYVVDFSAPDIREGIREWLETRGAGKKYELIRKAWMDGELDLGAIKSIAERKTYTVPVWRIEGYQPRAKKWRRKTPVMFKVLTPAEAEQLRRTRIFERASFVASVPAQF